MCYFSLRVFFFLVVSVIVTYLASGTPLSGDGPRTFMLGCRWPGCCLAMDFAFVPDQMFCFSLVTICIVVPYYTARSLELVPE